MHGIDRQMPRHRARLSRTGGRLSSSSPARYPSSATFESSLVEFIASYAAMWQAASRATPSLGKLIDEPRQRQSEQKASRFLRWLEEWLPRYPKSEAKRATADAQLMDRLDPLMTDCLGFPVKSQGLLLGAGYRGATGQFVRAAKGFAADMDPGDLFQALRNVWVANSIQVFLGRPVKLSPSIFGYSMLYPYTDNYLDDPKRSRDAKAAMGDWLTRRLGHRPSPPRSTREKDVAHLLGLIDQDYPPGQFPEVHASLRAIHRAQVRSLAQQQSSRPLTDLELLEVSLEKGGTSVLADGYLVAGQLEKTEAHFLFGYGALLQLLDDLQDCRSDRAVGHETLFSRALGAGPLDELASRLHHFSRRVLASCRDFGGSRDHGLPALLERSSALSTLFAVAGNQECFSRPYLDQLEACSPFRFSFIEAQGKRRAEKLRQATRAALERIAS
jgi:hypothetical protein